MIKLTRRGLLAGVAGSLLGASLVPLRAETEKPPAEGGLGGTGIVGTLMGMGSLIVNGFRIETDVDTAYSSTLGAFEAASLAIGQTLTIEATADASGLVARRVHVTYPLVGRVEVRPGGPGRLRVAGVDVDAEPDGMTAVRAGDRVMVSGVWRGDKVVAGRIDPAPGVSVSAIAGAVRVEQRSGQLLLGGRLLQLAAGLEVPADGSFVTVIGRAAADRFIAERLVPGRFTGAAGPLVQLSVDGYLDPIAAAPQYKIAGLGHSFDPEAKLVAFRNVRGLFTGPYVGVFAVHTGIVLPESFLARQRLIEELAARPSSAIAVSTR